MTKISRQTLTTAIVICLLALFTYAFWPAATLVDMGQVTTGKMQVIIEEDGYTRVDELYVVSAPISGRMLRIELDSGDMVYQNQTIITSMLPNLLGITESEQAKANVQVAVATVAAAKATLERVQSQFVLAQHRAERATKQVKVGAISLDENDQLQQNVQSASAEVAEAQSMLDVHVSELAKAKAALLGNQSTPLQLVKVTAPITGKVLSIDQRNETVLTAGAPILTIGNVVDDLEIVVEMLSTDAVLVRTGQKVQMRNWDNMQTGFGEVIRIEPLGFIKTSALGVEERRVNVIVKPDQTALAVANMGHGYRVDAGIILWESEDDAILVPTSAMFRDGSDWAVFVVENGKTKMVNIAVKRNNGLVANVVDGLDSGVNVVLYPSASLLAGESVIAR